jgi:predicted DNA-binding protein (MmcQ/YjbR family)
MTLDEVISFTTGLPDVEECFPFGPDTLVYKTNNKIFLLVSLDKEPLQMNAKCDPDQAIILRETYPSIVPGYHMNKRHWNTITPGPGISNKLVKELIANSHLLVTKKR